ncbi:retrovirus-related pol polyprotein from transposon TNT 1-94 [Tanacetum coccineum]
MTSVKSYLHKYVEQPGPNVVFRDESACTTEGYGSIKCNGIVFTKVAFVNCLKCNLVSINQLCDAKYIVQFNEKRGTIFNSNKEIVMISPRVRYVYVLDINYSEQSFCFFAEAAENLNWLWHKILAHLNFKTKQTSSIKKEPKKVSEAFKHLGWVDAIQEELNQYARNKVWTLVPASYGKTIIYSKWVGTKEIKLEFSSKNKARLVAQGYNQQEGIDYHETFALIAKLEAIRIFLAFSSYMNVIVYQIDVKSAFLNGKLKEEVYVKQPLGFESNEFPNHVCKLDKALYGLKQAPRAWCDPLSSFLIEHKFVREYYIDSISSIRRIELLWIRRIGLHTLWSFGECRIQVDQSLSFLLRPTFHLLHLDGISDFLTNLPFGQRGRKDFHSQLMGIHAGKRTGYAVSDGSGYAVFNYRPEQRI